MKRVILTLTLFSFLLPFSSAMLLTTEEINSSFTRIYINDAVNLFGYEAIFTIESGTASTSQSQFLGSSSVAIYGAVTRNGQFFVYGSRLDNTGTGVSGNGYMANITHTGNIALVSHYAVFGDGSTEFVTYGDDGEPEDIVTTPPGSVGGGGGTASLVSQSSQSIQVSPEELIINAIQNKLHREQLSIRNIGTESITIELSTDSLDSALTLGELLVELSPGEEKTIFLDIFARRQELLAGKILLRQGTAILKEIPVIINVRSENFLLDSRILLNQRTNKISLGSNVEVAVEIIQVGPEEQIEILAGYQVKDFSGNALVEQGETLSFSRQLKTIRTLNTEGLPIGKYVVGLEVVYPGAFSISSTQFEIVGKNEILIQRISLALITFAVLIAVFLIYWAMSRKKKLKKSYRKI